MKITDLMIMSIANLWKRKLRTVLTILGVVIGITSIVVMIALGNGLKEAMLENISSYSSMTQIQVNAKTDYNGSDDKNQKKYLDDTLVKQLSKLDHVTEVYPKLQTSVLAKYGKYIANLDLTGLPIKTLQNMNLTAGEGSLPKAGEELKLFFGYNVLMNFYVEKTGKYPYYENQEKPDIDLMKSKLFYILDTESYWNTKNGSSSESTSVKAPKKYMFPTSGILEGTFGEWNNSNSSMVFCDIDALKKQLKKAFRNKAVPGQPTQKSGKPYKELYYSQLIVQVDDINNVAPLVQTIGDLGYDAYSDADWIKSQTQQMNTIQMVLGAIGAVAMLVAAISITNTMMMSIYERTKEIGVMKVLGCDMCNIQAMFLMEAGIIGFLGGAVGVMLSFLLRIAINLLAASSALTQSVGNGNICRIPLWLPFASILFAVFIGMFAGFIPSLRAMRLSPLAAIKNE